MEKLVLTIKESVSKMSGKVQMGKYTLTTTGIESVASYEELTPDILVTILDFLVRETLRRIFETK